MIRCEGMDPEREALANAELKATRERKEKREANKQARNKGRNGTVLPKTCWRCKRDNVPYYRAAREKDGFDTVCCDCRIEMSLASRTRSPERLEAYRAKQRVWWRNWSQAQKAQETQA